MRNSVLLFDQRDNNTLKINVMLKLLYNSRLNRRICHIGSVAFVCYYVSDIFVHVRRSVGRAP